MGLLKNLKGRIMYGIENDYGNEATPSLNLGIVTSAEFTPKNNLKRYKDLNRRSSSGILYGDFSVDGTVSSQVTDFSLFRCILGSVSGNGATGNAYVYPSASGTFEAGIATLPSVTFELGRTDESNNADGSRVLGCKCNTATLNFSMGEIVTLSTTWIGQTSKKVTSLVSYNAVTDEPFNYINGTAYRNTNATTIGSIQNGSLTLNNDLKQIRECNNRFIVDLLTGEFTSSLSLTVVGDTAQYNTLWNDVYGQTSTSGPIAGTTGKKVAMDYFFVFAIGTNRTVEVEMEAYIESIGEAIENNSSECTYNVSGEIIEVKITEVNQ